MNIRGRQSDNTGPLAVMSIGGVRGGSTGQQWAAVAPAPGVGGGSGGQKCSSSASAVHQQCISSAAVGRGCHSGSGGHSGGGGGGHGGVRDLVIDWENLLVDCSTLVQN